MLIFDVETDGLLDTLTTIHSLVIYDTETDKLFSCKNTQCDIFNGEFFSLQVGLNMLQEAKEIAGHNIIKFDIPAIQKLYPTFRFKGWI